VAPRVDDRDPDEHAWRRASMIASWMIACAPGRASMIGSRGVCAGARAR